MAYLVEVYLPVIEETSRCITEIEARLTDKFGGITMHVNSPAKGLWKNHEDHLEHDEVIVVEVMADDIDRDWWSAFRAELETLLRQDEIVVRATEIIRL
jgi:hypothetical protein